MYYRNNSAKRIAILSKITLVLLIIFLVISFFTSAMFEELSLVIAITISLIVTYFLLDGFAEIIELLQSIKDKK